MEVLLKKDVAVCPHAGHGEAVSGVGSNRVLNQVIAALNMIQVSVSAFSPVLGLLKIRVLDCDGAGLVDYHPMGQYVKIRAVGAWPIGIHVVHPAVPGMGEGDSFGGMDIKSACTGFVEVQVAPPCSRMLPHADGEIFYAGLGDGFTYLVDAGVIPRLQCIPDRNVYNQCVGSRVNAGYLPVEGLSP